MGHKSFEQRPHKLGDRLFLSLTAKAFKFSLLRKLLGRLSMVIHGLAMNIRPGLYKKHNFEKTNLESRFPMPLIFQ